MKWACVLAFLVAASLTDAYNYCSTSKQHVLCNNKVSSACTGTLSNHLTKSLTAAQKKVVLQYHNELRAKVASGRQSPQPSASNMKKLEWDDELAAMAQGHANGCKFDHDCGSCTDFSWCHSTICRARKDGSYTGQNLAYKGMWGSGVPKVDDAMLKEMIQGWYDEVKDVNPRGLSSYGSSTKSRPNAMIGHYTQMVWADTDKVGCGVIEYMDGEWYKVMLTCDYGPGGNIMSRPVYKEGRPCSACSNGCSSDGVLCN